MLISAVEEKNQEQVIGCWQGKGEDMQFKRVVRKCLAEKMTHGQRPEGGEVDTQRRAC